MRRFAPILILAASSLACRRDTTDVQGAAPVPTPHPAAPAAPPPPAPGPIQVPPAERDAISLQNGFAPIVARVAPAVVNISSVRVLQGGRVRAPSRLREFFGEQFFPEVPRERREQAQGSGVIVSEDGYVLTNNHVVEQASEVQVVLQDRRELRAKIVGTDPKTDIAVLKIDGERFAFAPFGDSTKVRVGEFALAVGNPFAIGQTVTLGIISAVGRGNMGIVDYEDFLQTDAAINPGNSGGALVNAAGELIGINTAILARGAAGNQGIGFAVPAHLARAVMDQILQHGRVVRGWMGVGLQDITPALAEALGRKDARGVVVGEVSPSSPANAAGLQRGDIVVEIDGEPVVDSRALRMRISQSAPGTKVRLGIDRDGKRREVTLVLDELPERPRPAPEER
jgi:serine protease Do